MEDLGLLLLAIAVFVFALVARRLMSTIITAPMVFLAVGAALSLTGWFPTGDIREALHIVAEIALVLLLFFDASRTDLAALREHHLWPKRMLLFGLPLAMLIGTIAAWSFLPSWPLAALALVAALLAPTDAALGQSVVTNRAVPERVRRGLIVESGLNDGLALPLILLFASLTGEIVSSGERNWLLFATMQLLLGPLAGLVAGWCGGKLMLLAEHRGWTSGVFEGISALAIAAIAYLLAAQVGGNGFIATFVAGLTFGGLVRGRFEYVFQFTDSEGQLVMWAAFFLLGIVLVPDAVMALTWPMAAMILTSLVVVRPLAIWLSLMGSDAHPATRLFFGWFGPRGLATALFALLVVAQVDGAIANDILAIAINTVWMSAALHGVTSAPIARVYARHVRKQTDLAEHRPVPDFRRPGRSRSGLPR